MHQRFQAAEILEESQGNASTRFREESKHLPPEPIGGQSIQGPCSDGRTDEPAVGPAETKAEPGGKTCTPEDPRWIVTVRTGVEDPEQARLEVREPPVRVLQGTQALPADGDGHGVDREIPPKEILNQRARLDPRQGRRRGVPLAAGCGHIQPPRGPGPGGKGGCPKPGVDRTGCSEGLRQVPGKGDPRPLDHEVKIGARVSKAEIADETSHGIHLDANGFSYLPNPPHQGGKGGRQWREVFPHGSKGIGSRATAPLRISK